MAPVTDQANRRFYDLRPLKRDSGDDYIAKDEATGNIYKLNVCGSVRSESWKVSDPSRMGVYRELKDGGHSLGTYTDKPHVSHDVLSLSYLDGSTCPEQPNAKMGSVIAFVCDHNTYGVGQPEFVASVGGCSFFFTWKTQYACSTTSRGVGSAIGTAFSTILLLLVMAVAGLFLYNRFVLKKSGRDQLPYCGPSIVEAWEFAKDMSMIAAVTVWDKLRAIVGRSSARGFQGLPTDEH